MAFSLKKWIGSMLFSAFMSEYNENMEAIEDKFGEVEGDIDLFEAHMAESANRWIVESGSNENGYYIKFGDETMVCRFTDTAITTPDVPVGSLYFSNFKTFTYPKPFVISPDVSPAGKRASNQYSWTNVVTVSPTNVTLCVGAVNQYQTRYLGYIAIGRWK